jgi:hypothetical protein
MIAPRCSLIGVCRVLGDSSWDSVTTAKSFNDTCRLIDSDFFWARLALARGIKNDSNQPIRLQLTNGRGGPNYNDLEGGHGCNTRKSSVKLRRMTSSLWQAPLKSVYEHMKEDQGRKRSVRRDISENEQKWERGPRSKSVLNQNCPFSSCYTTSSS